MLKVCATTPCLTLFCDGLSLGLRLSCYVKVAGQQAQALYSAGGTGAQLNILGFFFFSFKNYTYLFLCMYSCGHVCTIEYNVEAGRGGARL